jgi:small-conductance mechanosensitive channel
VNTINFDWRWIGVIFLILMLLPLRGQVNLTAVPVLAIAAAWLILSALEPWRAGRSSFSSTKVTYWRGQRIETRQPARARLRSVSSIQMLVSVLYLLLGVASAFAAIFWFARLSGLF